MSGACAQCGTESNGVFCAGCMGQMTGMNAEIVRRLEKIGALGTARVIGREALLVDGAPRGTAARELAETIGEEEKDAVDKMDGVDAPRGEPGDIGGPSTAPVLPRSAQDDRIFRSSARGSAPSAPAPVPAPTPLAPLAATLENL